MSWSGRYCVSKSIIVSAMRNHVNTIAARAVAPKPKCQALAEPKLDEGIMHIIYSLHVDLFAPGSFPEVLQTRGKYQISPPLPFVPAELHGKLVVGVLCCYAGAVEEGEKVVKPLKEFGSPVLDLCVPKPFLAHQGMFDPSFPHVFSGNPGETGTGPPIKTFGGDAFGINSHRYVLIPRQLAAG